MNSSLAPSNVKLESLWTESVQMFDENADIQKAYVTYRGMTWVLGAIAGALVATYKLSEQSQIAQMAILATGVLVGLIALGFVAVLNGWFCAVALSALREEHFDSVKAWRRITPQIPQLLLFAVLSRAMNSLLGMAEGDSSQDGIGESMWEVAAALALPLIVDRNANAPDALTESAKNFKSTWKPIFSADVDYSLPSSTALMGYFFAALVLCGVLGAPLVFTGKITLQGLGFTLLAIAAAFLPALCYFQMTVSGIFAAKLYLAVCGSKPAREPESISVQV